MAGFCKLAVGLRAPKLVAAGAKSPIVSGGYLKYSRFRETAAGDRVRSTLRGRGGSLLVEQIASIRAGVTSAPPLSAKTARGLSLSMTVTPTDCATFAEAS